MLRIFTFTGKISIMYISNMRYMESYPRLSGYNTGDIYYPKHSTKITKVGE